MGQGRNLDSEIVLNHIAVGTNFDDAKAILLAAGFIISTHPPASQTTGPLTYKNNIFCTLKVESHFPFSTDFTVKLTPKSPGDYTTVSAVTAEFNIVSL